MQKVDYFLGIPLCFLFSLLNKIFLLFGPAKVGQVTSYLFIELSEMGSAILAYPAIEMAAKKVGKENVYFLIFENNKESVEILNIIPRENILTINSDSFISFIPSLFQTILRIRNLKISACLDLELFSRCTALISFLSGSGIRAGFSNYTEEGLYRGDLFTHNVYYNGNIHMSENFMSLFLSLETENCRQPLLKEKINRDSFALPYFKSEQSNKKFDDLLKQNNFLKGKSKLFLLNPDPGLLKLRAWPEDYYAQLAKYILEFSEDNFVGIIGLKHSKRYFDNINNYYCNKRLIDLTGSTSDLKELIGLFNISHYLITNDSGPAHIASLTNTKTIVLFGPETPVRYRPLNDNAVSLFSGLACSPCYSAANHRHSACTDNICLKKISVEEVIRNLK